MAKHNLKIGDVVRVKEGGWGLPVILRLGKRWKTTTAWMYYPLKSFTTS